MKTYKIQITETLQRVVEIEASSLPEALSKVEDKYGCEQIVLDANDFKEFVIEEFTEG